MFDVAPDAPRIIQAVAPAVLAVHIGGGAVAIASGWAAVAMRKGSRGHAVAGTTFLVSMLGMCGAAAAIPPMQADPAWGNATMGLFTAYMVTSAWATARGRPGQVGRLERAAVGMALGVVALAVGLTVASAAGILRGGDSNSPWIMGLLAGLAAAHDLKIFRVGGLTGPARTRRHVWRMCFGLFAANGSFFLGQPDHVPELLKDTGLNVAPVVGVLAVLAFWMIRLTRRRTPRRAVAA